jgi:hypothetical protein
LIKIVLHRIVTKKGRETFNLNGHKEKNRQSNNIGQAHKTEARHIGCVTPQVLFLKGKELYEVEGHHKGNAD